KLKVYADDKKAQQEFMNIKYQNKVRLAKYILEHNGVEVDPRSIFDVHNCSPSFSVIHLQNDRIHLRGRSTFHFGRSRK
ncbi:glycogen/starch/alpha-glucan phosphorylase, partial [Marvinbryantia sp.]|uniref:glycogen/starch/alpha-glucan phosphorylase n=1 Tax=Marvinbryantia sp. TaxID=2496532 RepID=UPI003A8FD9B5